MHRRMLVLSLLRADTVVVGDRDEVAILAANADEDIMREGCNEMLIAAHLAPLIKQAIECLLGIRVRMNQHKRIALALDLGMKAGNNWVAYHEVIGRISPQAHHQLIQRV